MRLFFILDSRGKYRFFSSAPVSQVEVRFSRWQELWRRAKKKLMLLPGRILSQEQAFGRVLKMGTSRVEISHSGRLAERKIQRKFTFFLHRQRSKHIFLLAGECILLPISGLMALLPGPNVFFGFLALIMVTHWQALCGINRLRDLDHSFVASALLREWEDAVIAGDREIQENVLARLEKKWDLEKLNEILQG